MAIIASDPTLPKGKRGGKLNRSETVTVRLDPKLNYLCDLAARAQRRTKSSFIEWAIENALSTVGIPGERSGAGGELYTIADRNADLWDVEEPDRLVALVQFATSLLTHEEQLIWKVIATSPYLWRGKYYQDGEDQVWGYDNSKAYNLIMDRLREVWEQIKIVAEGEANRDEFWQLKTRIVRGKVLSSEQRESSSANGTYDDLDDDIPF